jgi:four helix bundle protein
MLEAREQGTGDRGSEGRSSISAIGDRNMDIRSYRDLLVWQKAMDLVTAVYQATISFPKHELYGLASQTQRAAVSIPANIAEGHDRDSTKEYLRHVVIAVGSLAELETLVTIGLRLRYLDVGTHDTLQSNCRSLGRMLRDLQRALRARHKRKEAETE